MALNIPVNLMATALPPTQAQTAPDATVNSTTLTSIQPASGGAASRGTASDGGAGSGANGSSAQQFQAVLRRAQSAPAQTTPDRAEPKSIVTAQTAPPQPKAAEQPAKAQTPQTEVTIRSELDRFAPPNPLPTAPILQLAASYAALTNQAA